MAVGQRVGGHGAARGRAVLPRVGTPAARGAHRAVIPCPSPFASSNPTLLRDRWTPSNRTLSCDTWKPSNKKEIRRRNNLSLRKKLVGIFPGSRTQELEKHLPDYLKMADKLMGENKNIECAIGLAPEFNEREIKNQYKISRRNSANVSGCGKTNHATYTSTSILHLTHCRSRHRFWCWSG